MEDFLYGGISALLLSTIQLHPECRVFSLVVLVPFLYRATRVCPCRAALLGILMAGCYTSVTHASEALVAPSAFSLRLLVLAAVFAAFGIAANRLKRHLGFHPVFVAVLWLPFEYVLTRPLGPAHLFADPNVDSILAARLIYLFGTLSVAFVVVLVNAVLLIVFERVIQELFGERNYKRPADENTRFLSHFEKVIRFDSRRAYPVQARAPPSA